MTSISTARYEEVTVAFVDTGAWIALMSRQDALHRRARTFFQSIARNTKLTTSNYVLSETITWLAYHRARNAAVSFWQTIEASERAGLLTLEWVTMEVHQQAWDLFQRCDKVLSFCDCTSFALCYARPVDFVFGFDQDFRTAGFELRPR